jgi:tRNA 2-thiouridine synthesizing protein A
VIVDTRGLLCPLPIIRLAAATRAAEAGTEITVLWTDPAARHDIGAWARMRGHTVIDVRPAETGDGAFATQVLLGTP